MQGNFTFFNPDAKRLFLDYYSKNKDTVRTISYMLEKAKSLEKQLDKDLSHFDMFEIDQLAKSIDTSSEQVLRTTFSAYSTYTDWAISKRIGREDGMNFYRLFLNQRMDLKRYVLGIDAKNMYLSEEDVDIIVGRLINAQDRAMFLALYEGIRGEKYSEIRNLKIEHINYNTNEITLYDIDKTRKITISDRLKNALHEADDQKRYIINNGGSVGQLSNNKRMLEASKYIFKNKPGSGVMGSEDDERIAVQTVSKFIGTVKKYLKDILSEAENNYEFITARSVYDSGIINKVLDAYNSGEIVDFNAGELEKILPEYKLTRNQISNMKRKIELVMNIQVLY